LEITEIGTGWPAGSEGTSALICVAETKFNCARVLPT
jgi:hypothetical protein